MRYLIRLLTVLAGLLGLLTAVPAIQAQADDGESGGRAVFVQTNNPAGNAIDVFARSDNGALTFNASYPTGGAGGRTAGSASDPLASQGSLVYDAERHLLLAVNAGSDTVSVFGVRGTTLRLNQVIGSNGPFPTSIGVHGNLVYVLDAGNAGYVQGYRIDDGRLHPIAGSLRSLNLPNINPPFFLTAPAQVGFTPDGEHLVVPVKLNGGGSVDVFSVTRGGRLSAQATSTVTGGLPFAFTFGPAEQLALVNAAFGTLSTYAVREDGSLTLISAGPSSGQAAACWVDPARSFELVGNTGSGDISEYRIGDDGAVLLTNPVAAAGISGAIDIASTGRFVYEQAGTGSSVSAFLISENGTLSSIGTFAVPNGGSQEGIAAS